MAGSKAVQKYASANMRRSCPVSTSICNDSSSYSQLRVREAINLTVGTALAVAQAVLYTCADLRRQNRVSCPCHLEDNPYLTPHSEQNTYSSKGLKVEEQKFKKGRFNIKFADADDCPVVTYQICPEVFRGEGQ